MPRPKSHRWQLEITSDVIAAARPRANRPAFGQALDAMLKGIRTDIVEFCKKEWQKRGDN